MRLTLKHNLPFVSLTAIQAGRSVDIPTVLVDTGSASTILSIDLLSRIGIAPEPNDTIHQIRGVGGTEAVFRRRLESVELGDASVADFAVEVGAMDYGFNIQGIIGTDLLLQTGAIIDLAAGELRFPS